MTKEEIIDKKLYELSKSDFRRKFKLIESKVYIKAVRGVGYKLEFIEK